MLCMILEGRAIGTPAAAASVKTSNLVPLDLGKHLAFPVPLGLVVAVDQPRVSISMSATLAVRRVFVRGVERKLTCSSTLLRSASGIPAISSLPVNSRHTAPIRSLHPSSEPSCACVNLAINSPKKPICPPPGPPGPLAPPLDRLDVGTPAKKASLYVLIAVVGGRGSKACTGLLRI